MGEVGALIQALIQLYTVAQGPGLLPSCDATISHLGSKTMQQGEGVERHMWGVFMFHEWQWYPLLPHDFHWAALSHVTWFCCGPRGDWIGRGEYTVLCVPWVPVLRSLPTVLLAMLYKSYYTWTGKCSWNSCSFQENVLSVCYWCWVCVLKSLFLLLFICGSQVV